MQKVRGIALDAEQEYHEHVERWGKYQRAERINESRHPSLVTLHANGRSN